MRVFGGRWGSPGGQTCVLCQFLDCLGCLLSFDIRGVVVFQFSVLGSLGVVGGRQEVNDVCHGCFRIAWVAGFHLICMGSCFCSFFGFGVIGGHWRSL